MLAASWQRKKTICRKLQAILVVCVQWVCGFLGKGFLADFSPAFLSLRPCGLEAGDFIAGLVSGRTGVLWNYLTCSSVSCELRSVYLKLSFFSKRQKHNKFLSFLACCLFRERKMLASTWFWQPQGTSRFFHCCSHCQVKCFPPFCAFILLLWGFLQRWCAGNDFGLSYVISWKLQQAVCQPVSIKTNSPTSEKKRWFKKLWKSCKALSWNRDGNLS